MAATQMSKKRKVSPLKEYDFHAHTRPDFVADGVFLAELNEVLTRELAEDGYSGVEVRATPVRTEIIIRATRLGTFSADSLCYKLLGGLAVRRACCGVHRFVMESGARRCEVIVSGKLRAQRAKSMKFKDGYMISSGQPVNEYIDAAVWHVLVRQGVLGIKLKIMLDWDPKGKQGPKTPLPDLVTIHQPKEDYIRLPVVATEIPVGLVAS